MSFRTRLVIAFLFATLVPLAVLAVIVRQETRDIITGEYELRVNDVLDIIREDLDSRRANIQTALSDIAKSIADDNDFRLALASRNTTSRRYILDYAKTAIDLTGLSTLYVLDSRGVVISSGHFRNEYDRVERDLVETLSNVDSQFALIEVRTPDSVVVSLSTLVNVNLGGNKVSLVGGHVVGSDFVESLTRSGSVTVRFLTPDSTNTKPGDPVLTETVRQVMLPYVPLNRSEVESATIEVAYILTGLEKLITSLDAWFILAGIAAVLFSFVLAWLLATRISRPVRDLSYKMRKVDLDHLNINFHSSRSDEIGDLSRTMGAMVSRLRKSRQETVESERRAAIGDMARQVNHDIKNGLTPIRNIVRHMQDASDGSDLKEIFDSRKQTLGSSITYLYELASNYARLSSPLDMTACDLNATLSTLVEDTRASGFNNISLESSGPVYVQANELALRRIFDNLVSNAVEAVQLTESSSGIVSISLSEEAVGHEIVACVSVRDEGGGIPSDQLDRVFDDFYTTRENGTGLGLSIVRRLVMDLNGTVEVASEVGRGTVFTVTIPTVVIPGKK